MFIDDRLDLNIVFFDSSYFFRCGSTLLSLERSNIESFEKSKYASTFFKNAYSIHSFDINVYLFITDGSGRESWRFNNSLHGEKNTHPPYWHVRSSVFRNHWFRFNSIFLNSKTLRLRFSNYSHVLKLILESSPVTHTLLNLRFWVQFLIHIFQILDFVTSNIFN